MTPSLSSVHTRSDYKPCHIQRFDPIFPLVKKTGIIPATVNKALSHLEQLGIVKELTAQKRNRLFSYVGYTEILSRGTELPSG